jgi:Trk K+ transport system NAD-binding subunit
MTPPLDADAPVILYGLGKVGASILEFLRATGLPVVVVDLKHDPSEARFAHAKFIRGDFRDPAVLEQAGIAKARSVLIVTSDDLVNISAALMARRLNPNVRVVVRMFNQNLLARLGKAVTNMRALSVSALTAPLLAQSALTGDVLGAFDIGEERRQVAKLVIGPESSLTGQRLAEVARQFGVLVLSHNAKLLRDIPEDAALSDGDEIVVCGSPRDLGRLLPLGLDNEWQDLLPGVQWAGRLRRFGRVAWRAVAEIDLALKIVACVLLTVITVSTFIYTYFGLAPSAPAALYRTVSAMATTGDLKADNFTWWQKIFAAGLRIIGALLTAAMTAIFANYLIRARLGGALEVRRIPDSGHVVVCGLGNVGYRVVEELLKANERVVVIERSRDNPFIGTVRRLGAAVIFGDAAVTEVLRQARAGASRAVVAATSNDLVNFEIALLARELHPKQRVVVRLVDDALAEMLREVVDVRLAVSLPALAAPAFVAALYGDRVQSIFRLGRTVVAGVEFTVRPNDPCLNGQSMSALAIDYGLIPIAGLATGKRLQEGDQFTVIATLTDLERLFRRDPAPADWMVELTSVPAITRDQVTLLARTENGWNAETANEAMKALPLRLGGPRTRGQADELLALLARERAEAHAVRVGAV